MDIKVIKKENNGSNDMTNNVFLQTKNQKYIKSDLGSELWIRVYHEEETESSKMTFWGYFVSNDQVEDSLRTTNWDLLIGDGLPGCSMFGDDVEYDRFGHEGFEPLVYVRHFNGDKESYVEVSEEFRLFHNLYHDKKENIYYKVDESGDAESVIRINGKNVEIKLKHLKEFLAIKEMHLALCFEFDQYSDESLNDMGLPERNETFSSNKTTYDLQLMDLKMYAGDKETSLSRITGKKLIPGVDKESSGVWPYTKNQYEEFIYDSDENGNDILFTCNPKKLKNNFGANPDSPDYLTPIFFKREVLDRYYSKPSIFSVDDGHVSCKGSWLLRLDNHNSDYIIVYLGDLGQYIPHKEQKHWRNYNISPDGELSDVKFKRDFKCEWAEPEISDLKFKADFKCAKESWLKKWGWDLFLDLNTGDMHHYSTLRIPTTNEQSEFDNQVGSLVKILIDSINEKEINKHLKTSFDGSISRLEEFLKENGIQGYEKHIEFLRNLQRLRSTGVAHRKGKKYEKNSKYFGIGDKNLSDIFDDILKDAIEFLEFIENISL